MPQYQLKRELTDIVECDVVLWGPYVGTEKAPGFGKQLVDFKWGNGTVAVVSLASAKSYEALVTLIGEKGGKVALSFKPVGATEYKDLPGISIPDAATLKSLALGYIHTDSIQIQTS